MECRPQSTCLIQLCLMLSPLPSNCGLTVFTIIVFVWKCFRHLSECVQEASLFSLWLVQHRLLLVFHNFLLVAATKYGRKTFVSAAKYDEKTFVADVELTCNEETDSRERFISLVTASQVGRPTLMFLHCIERGCTLIYFLSCCCITLYFVKHGNSRDWHCTWSLYQFTIFVACIMFCRFLDSSVSSSILFFFLFSAWTMNYEASACDFFVSQIFATSLKCQSTSIKLYFLSNFN